MNKRWELVFKIIFFGAVWGIIEATLGYALHLLPALIAGSLMFPLVMLVLYKAHQSIESRKAIMFVGIVAILIKATNLFLPMLPPAKTINPMIAMFLQSLLVFAVIPILTSDKPFNKVSAIAFVSVTWRLGMVGYYLFNAVTNGFIDFRIASFDPAFSFIVIEGLISAALAIVLLFATNQIKVMDKINRMRINPVVSTVLLAIAVFLTLVKF
ncbi:MAG: hypothetical protein RQ856_00015 [Candidatus Izemoplasmatales bacterium]|nr:hypothetical protein [Candidatus Izemoplasmatales bacterium]